MGLLLKKNVDNGCILGIWEITEDYGELFSKLSLNYEELSTLSSFLNYQRKLEWLSVRVLMNEILGRDSQIIYNEVRKPFLFDYSHNISISHSRNMTSILLSKSRHVGIDMEFMSHQITKIAHKFINEKEVISGDPDQRRIHLYIHWCAKEALYKICDKQDINFKQNLTILPFEVLKEGIIEGLVDNRYGHDHFYLNYFFVDGYVVVWCIK
jgi:4'-phosphopantetheinyl transferase